MTYRARYFTALQTAPVLDLLMNDDLNPRSLAFQLKDLAEHCRYLAGAPLGIDWPASRQKRIEETAAKLSGADVMRLCAHRLPLDDYLADLDASLAAFSDALTNIYFSHAEMELAT